MSYEVRVRFDDQTADIPTMRTYFRALDKYDALGIGHEKTRTSSMLIPSGKPLDLESLARELGDIKILSVRKVA